MLELQSQPMARIFRDYWSQFITGMSTLGLTIGSLGFTIRTQPVPSWHERWEVWVFWSSVIGAVISIYATAKNSQSVSRLAGEKSGLLQSLTRLQSMEEEIQQKYSDLCSLHLSALMLRMGLMPNDRVSIYKHNGTSSFYRIARYSNHPDHAKPGRSIYPDDEGCIGAAFREGSAFAESLPANQSRYENCLAENWNIPTDVAQHLTMKSRSIAAFALQKPVGGRRFAIIVFESMASGRIDQDCRERFTNEEREGIIQWLETMERFEPKPSEAEREGF
jgi:hypothetical protein